MSRSEQTLSIAVKAMPCLGVHLFMHGAIHYDAYVVLDADAVVDPGLSKHWRVGWRAGRCATVAERCPQCR